VEASLTHVLEGHSREVLCMDVQREGGSCLVVTGSTDKTVMVFRLGPEGVSKVLHRLEEHKLKVKWRKAPHISSYFRSDASESTTT
jgi:hypothetical protein